MQPGMSKFFVRKRGISSWPEVEDRREKCEGRTETGFARTVLNCVSSGVF